MAEGEIDVEELYRKYGPMVVRRCRRLLGNDEEAWDAAQEVFVALLRNRERLSAQYPSSLLFRMATNLSLNRIRDRRLEPALPGDEILHRIATWQDPDTPLFLDGLFRGQAESTRTMAVMHHLDGMTLEQVARECGMSISGVRKRLRGLRAHLESLTRQSS